ncbi:hypothetical protein LIY46_11320 [Fusobacterium varium]|uniref:hypothetical protein n=1 Tax=Fusobacterium TaxID=848 RepID=UPI001032679E|nr:hypothetical protein [Fusobacterium ulcerans]
MKKIVIIFMLAMLSLNIYASVKGTTLNGYLFARTKEQMVKLVEYVRNNNKKEFIKYIKELQITGEGGALDGGLEVEIVDSSQGLVQIRLVGRTETVWTVTEAINRE